MTIGFGPEYVRPEDLDDYDDLPAITPETVRAAIPTDGQTTLAALAEHFGVPATSADLRRAVWELAQGRAVSFHETTGEVRHFSTPQDD